MKKFFAVIVSFTLMSFGLACEQPQQAYKDGTMKAKWIEVQTSLPFIATSQVAYKAMSNRYAKTFDEMGFAMTEHQRYTYFMGKDVRKGFAGPAKLPAGLNPKEPDAETFLVYAVANLDGDPDLDIWKIDQDRNLKHIRNDQ